MDMPILAVLIRDSNSPCTELEGVLGDLSVEVYSVKRWAEAKALIELYQAQLVFVELNIWKQSYSHMVNTAITADQPFNIIVVGSLPDIENYVSAIERGAFNFVAPPFARDVLAEVVYTAAMDARDRRKSLARAPFSHSAR
jgi:DNA-binding NtrC family response regulator